MFFCSSISSSSLEDGSPEQLVPRSGANSEIPHPPPHHMYGFMPLKDTSNDMQTTDSETSDITDHSADISDPSSISISASPGSSFQPIRQTPLWQMESSEMKKKPCVHSSVNINHTCNGLIVAISDQYAGKQVIILIPEKYSP